ncbi:MAG TPA: hypothetical protein VF713_02740 [Thermoanaerobaculia bacterium]
MNQQTPCTCDVFIHPAAIDNLPGLESVSYRAGDFAAFRRALLLARPGETALRLWRPGGSGDLAVQLVEWWAVLADILTFYNERIINESYLGTATQDDAVKNLVRLLGYRPRPGIAAEGVVAALISGSKPVTIAAGFQIQSKPGPGKQPQIFEVDDDTRITLPDSVAVDPVPDPALLRLDGGRSSLLLAGSITAIKANDRFLLRARNWSGAGSEATLVTVAETKKEKTPRGATNTRVVFTENLSLGTAPRAADWLLLRSTQSAGLFSPATSPIVTNSLIIDFFPIEPSPSTGLFSRAAASTIDVGASPSDVPAASVALRAPVSNFSRINVFDPGFVEIGPIIPPITTVPPVDFSPRALSHDVHLDGVYASITAADALLLERPGETPVIAFANSQRRDLWYANAPNADSPDTPPAPPPATNQIPIPIVHSRVNVKPVFLTGAVQDAWNGAAASVKASFGWVEAGTIIGAPATQFVPGATATLLAADGTAEALTVPRDVEIGDANGAGTSAHVITADSRSVALTNVHAAEAPLIAPLSLLTNLVAVSRGKSVSKEVLGSGDATVTAQTFVLKKSPLTYRASGNGYRSTLRVWVGDIEWHEVASFYAQAAEAKVFVTKEDADQKTHVLFGDGINGSRLPSGSGNVVASYRYGSGADTPEAGSLTVVLKPQPGVRGIRNPVRVFGGSDPDDAAKIRALAPKSVLTFGRAVSADDYQIIAAGAPGVQRATAAFSFDAALQRAVVTVYVGDDAGAESAARNAIAGSHDPNRTVIIKQAARVDCSISLTLRVSPDFDAGAVVARARAALEDADLGLLGTNSVRIGQVIYESQIDRACLSVEGTVAVRDLLFRRPFLDSTPRHDPGEGAFFRLVSLTINSEQV